MNHVSVGIDTTDEGRRHLRMDAYAPGLSRFEYRFDRGASHRAEANARPAIDGRHRVGEFRAVTQRGDRGPSSSMALTAHGSRAAHGAPDIARVRWRD